MVFILLQLLLELCQESSQGLMVAGVEGTKRSLKEDQLLAGHLELQEQHNNYYITITMIIS